MNSVKKYNRDGRSPIPVNEITSRVMSANKAINTGPELLLRRYMFRIGIRGYRLHWKKVSGRPDLVFVKRKVAVFVNGCYWHRCPYCDPHFPQSNHDFWDAKFKKNIERDKKKIALLKEDGWHVLILWECKIKFDIKKQVRKIEQMIRQ